MKMLPGILLRIVACFILLSLFSPLAAQEKIKFGKIDIADLKMNRCPFDSSADAMILGDIGQTYFLYDDLHGFSMIFERLIRIKILTKKGYSDANIEIPFYHLNQDEEKITSIKARTYNLENGKIVETKVTDESIFDEEVDAYWKNRKISFPAVREGSIVELKYSISSPFLFNLRSWYFQDRLPIRWSEYEVRIPEFFKYTKNATGFLSFVVNENSTNQSHINQMSTTYKGNALTANSATYEDNSVEYTEYNTRLATKDVPAFKEEPYTSSIKNFISKIEFSYTGYQFPRQPFHSKYSTWEEIIDDLEQDGDFGSQIRKKGLVKDIVNEINSKSNVPSDKMVLAFDFIKDDMKWNGQYSKYPTTNLREALENKSGNSADINLALVLLLRELGLQADPVILSTRNNGYIHKNFPSINKMNDVIALVALEGKDYFLDATSRMRSIGMLPFSCLNGEGLLVSKERMRWVPLLQDEKDNSLYFADFNILPSGEVNGNLQVSESGYSAVNDRINFSKNGSDNFKKSIKEEFTDWTLEDISLENIENPKETLKYTIRMNSQDIIQVSDSLLYLNVLLNMGRKTNPFLREQRDYPVDFGCPQKDSYVFNYEIPEGYVVKSLPEPLKISLPDQSGSFKFIIAVNGKKISVNTQITINKALYLETDYNDLRDFFNKIAEKHAQQIVLKKI